MSGLKQVGTFVIPARWREDYEATVTDGVYFAVRRGGLAADGAGVSGLRNDGPSMRMVMQ
jgi:bifunctional DNA-binding transcriptional regulator/antitoxin component of YhaV-PrlF toxin-antitoxin module